MNKCFYLIRFLLFYSYVSLYALLLHLNKERKGRFLYEYNSKKALLYNMYYYHTTP